MVFLVQNVQWVFEGGVRASVERLPWSFGWQGEEAGHEACPQGGSLSARLSVFPKSGASVLSGKIREKRARQETREGGRLMSVGR